MKRISLLSLHLLFPVLCFGMQIKKTKKPYYCSETSLYLYPLKPQHAQTQKIKDKKIKLDPWLPKDKNVTLDLYEIRGTPKDYVIYY